MSDLLAALAHGAVTDPAILAEANAGPVITITGRGQVAARPDVMIVTVGVATRSDDAEGGLAENSAKAQAIADAVRSAGVAACDVQTCDLSMYPIHEKLSAETHAPQRAPKLLGFKISNDVRLRLRDIDRAGETLSAIVAAGANEIRGIEFELDDEGAVMDEARKAAIADARRKAALYAEGAGVALGPIVSISEDGDGRSGLLARQGTMSMGDAPIAPGETVLKAAVRVVWRIAD